MRTVALADLPQDARGYVARGGRDLRSADDARSMRTARASPTPSTASARIWPRSRSIVELGTVRVLRIAAAHDVGRAINPTLVEGQIEGGIAQGLGLALMEEFLPGRGENLHDYLIPIDRRHAADRVASSIEDAVARRALRRQGHRRAGADPDRAGDPQRHPRCDGRAHHGACRRRPTASAPRSAATRSGASADMADDRVGASGARRTTRSAAMPVRYCAASARAARRLRPLRQSSTANWSASIRTWSSTARSRRAAASCRSAGRRHGTARSCDGPETFVTGDRRRHHLSRLQARALHRLGRGRRRRHGHRRDRGHLQLLRRQGEDRHRPPSRARSAALVRVDGEQVGHVTTAEYGSQMLSLGGVQAPDRRLQEGGPRHLRHAARAVQRRARSS